jgi:hypothetical protein
VSRTGAEPAARPHFVGRSELIAQVRSGVSDDAARHVYDIAGLRGAGKTALLGALREEAAAAGAAAVHHLDAGRYGRNEPSWADDAARSLYDLTTWLRVVGDLATEIGGDAFTRVSARSAAVADEALEQLQALGSAFLVWAERERTSIGREFVESWNTVTSGGRGVILVDDLHAVIREPVGRWLLRDIVGDLQNAVVVATRTATPDAFPYTGPGLASVYLRGLERQEITAYVAAWLRRTPSDAVVARCAGLTGGHSGALEIIRELVELRRDLPDSELASVLFDLPAQTADRLRRLVLDEILAVAKDASLERALRRGCVLRRFAPDLLERIVDPADPEELHERVVPALLAYGFVQYHEETANEPGEYAFQPVIREQLTRELGREPARLEQLHSAAEAWYAAKWGLYGETYHPAFYSAHAQFEQAGFQAYLREWLHHVPRAGGSLSDARTEFARSYFHGFWWWGWYVPFAFCNSLIESLAGERHPWARGWHAVLTAFAAGYPTGYAKKGQGNWNDVRRALLFVREQTGIAGDVEDLFAPGGRYVVDETRCDLRAITDMLLAHSCRYRPAGDDAERWYAEADRYYAEGWRLFEALEDEFNVPWALCERGDLDRERGRLDQALDRVSQSLRRAHGIDPVDQRDYEVLANCHRVRADIAFDRGDLSAAFRDYALAVRFAYVFQAWPQPADPYTAAVYGEMTDRALRRVDELWRDGRREEAWRGCSALRAVWEDSALPEPPPELVPLNRVALEAGDVTAVRASLFPPGPPPAAMGDTGSAYVIDATRVARAVASGLEDRA